MSGETCWIGVGAWQAESVVIWRSRSLASLVAMFAAAGLVALGLPQAAVAQTFDQASSKTLDQITLNFKTAADEPAGSSQAAAG